ncbi:hypothetical protein ACWEWG_31955 [Streptomyces sp. NPDC003758]
MALLDQVAVPSQHGVGLDQQPEPTQNLARQRHQQSGEEGSVFRGELHPVLPEPSLEDHGLVAQGNSAPAPTSGRNAPTGEAAGGPTSCEDG